ncbi:MAG TPA: Mov34/MPN/PAD-1 family protein [Acidimicrobiales bacterium]|nr:Mov34/MPN/PAD-1 family protein [Acidimicrobiales bacterium]
MSTTSSPPIVMSDLARERVARHLSEDTGVECGGILVGKVEDGTLLIRSAIEARRAVGTATSLTFTHEAWDEVNAVMAREHPDEKMVGWYHSHPDVGIFLSEYDTFIQSNFFGEPWQVAYVVDPIRDESAFFGWQGSELVQRPEASDDRGPVREPPPPPLSEERAPQPTRRTQPTRRMARPARAGSLLTGRNKAIGAGVLAVALFLTGFFVHTSNPPSKVSFSTSYAGSSLLLKATVSEKGGNATLTEVFSESDKKGTLSGSLTPCIPSGSALVSSSKNLTFVIPDTCNLDLKPGHTSATIVASGPATVILSGLAPANFNSGSGLFKIKSFSLKL